jgi:hypothetical protein
VLDDVPDWLKPDLFGNFDQSEPAMAPAAADDEFAGA